MSRRCATALGLALVLAGLTACGDEGAEPAGTTAVSGTPSESSSPSTDPEPEPEPTTDQPTAQAFVESFRFEDEVEWEQDVDFETTVDTTGREVLALECDSPYRAGSALAARHVVHPGAHVASVRQLVVFATAEDASAELAALRAQMRPCHVPGTRPSGDEQLGDVSFSVVGDQLALGTESFWVGGQELVPGADGADGAGTPAEYHWSAAALYVLDGNVLTVIHDPASSDEARADFVADASAEWEQLRPQLEGLGA